jgi:hypothetical protein
MPSATPLTNLRRLYAASTHTQTVTTTIAQPPLIAGNACTCGSPSRHSSRLENRFGRFRPTRVQIPPPPLIPRTPVIHAGLRDLRRSFAESVEVHRSPLISMLTGSVSRYCAPVLYGQSSGGAGD